ncbi:MAG: M48 family metalloprotease [Planctomycetes bacterium]|nr:M48 family metalloprotease [Planctomycetota bacterium]
MQMIVLMVFAVVLSLGSSPGPRLLTAGWPPLAAATLLYLGVTALLTAWITRIGVRRLLRAEGAFTATVHRHHRRLLIVQVWLVAGVAGLLAIGLTDRFVASPYLQAVPLLAEGVLLGVFLAALVIHWAISYRFDRMVRWQVEQDLMLAGMPVRSGWSLGEYLGFNLRHHFLFVAVPVGLIMLAHDVVDRAAAALPSGPSAVAAVLVVKAASVAMVFFFSPALLIRVWRTRPLPDGPLRRRLERLCRRIGLRYRQIRIWDTGGVLVNAGVMGLHRAVRYILISDALLEQMDDRQVVAVFGHEAGHVKQHHMSYFLLFIVAVMMVNLAVVSAGGIAAEALGAAPGAVIIVENAGMALLAILSIGVGFGWLSRQFERQSDVYGAWCSGLDAAEQDARAEPADGDLTAGAPWFITALESIARLNGIPRQGRNWRHGSIATRVAFLAHWMRAGRSRHDFDRQINRIKRLGWALAAVAVIGAVLTWRRW